jgi:hypothetical protein
MKKITLSIIVISFLALPVQAAKTEIARHVSSIEIGYGLDYGYPQDSLIYEFTSRIWTDSSVIDVEFSTPGGNTFSPEIISTDTDGTVYWEYYNYAGNTSFFDYFGDGAYTITVYYEGGEQDSTTAWFGIPRTNEYMPQPTQLPVLLSPENESIITSPLKFKWEPCEDLSANLIVLNLENNTTGETVGKWFQPMKTEWKKARLSAGLWDLDLSFGQRYNWTKNDDGISVRVSKYSESDYLFSIVN